jgi:hypothetical protein
MSHRRTHSARLCVRLRVWLSVLLLGLWIAGSLAGCTSVRPTIKIGVLAPFEGLHRRSGYAALDAVRAAIADFSYEEAGILPLALDDGAQPQQAVRSAQKLLVDPRVGAIVGPLTPDLGAAVAPVEAIVPISWYTPYSVAGQDWAIGLVRAAVGLAKERGTRDLVLAGWTPGWPRLEAQQWAEAVGMPVRLDDEPAGVDDQGTVFWMGSAEDGAAYLAELRDLQPATIFVLGPQGEDPVFGERLRGSDTGFYDVHWTVWTDAGYTEWTANHSNHSPNAYLVYRAALAALQEATKHSQNAPPSSWVVQLFRYDDQGAWTPAN